MAIFLPPYYAARTSMSLAAIGFAFMIVRLGDIAFDPLLGVAIDRTATSIGRFRPWMLLGIPIVMIGAGLTFFPPASAGLTYLIIALAFIFAGHSLVTVTQFSWAAVLADSDNERSRIYGWIQAASVLGMLLVLTMIPIIKAYLPDTGDLAVHGMGVVILVAVPLTVFFAAALIPEPDRAELKYRPSILKSLVDYGTLLRRQAVLRVMASTVFYALASGVTGSLYLFFANAKGLKDQASALLLVYFVAAFASARIWTVLSRRFGKHNVLAALCGYAFFVQLSAFFLPQGGFAWAALGQLVLGISYSGTLVMQRAIVGEAADEARRDLDEDVTGHLYALYTSITKMSVAGAVGVTFVALQWIGYVAKAGSANSPSAIYNLEWAFVLIPAVLTGAAALAMIGYTRSASKIANPLGERTSAL